ncbi:hypothetical protein HanPI659440_Chr06g0227161 [Helianthus annuus]|nr:hypothetical protein HanPI659440_Chr06g0227161 [Helianthus annuus]
MFRQTRITWMPLLENLELQMLLWFRSPEWTRFTKGTVLVIRRICIFKWTLLFLKCFLLLCMNTGRSSYTIVDHTYDELVVRYRKKYKSVDLKPIKNWVRQILYEEVLDVKRMNGLTTDPQMLDVASDNVRREASTISHNVNETSYFFSLFS